ATVSRSIVVNRPPSLVLVSKPPPCLPLPRLCRRRAVRPFSLGEGRGEGLRPSPSLGEQEKNMKVGRIPYLSCEPFYFEMERRGMALYDLVPSALTAAITKGEVDAGPVPLVDCFHLADQCRFLAGFCVATIRHARSVLLHAKQPIEALSDA